MHTPIKSSFWGQVNRTLDDLARAGNDAARAEVLRRIRVDCSSVNQKWIMRVSGLYLLGAQMCGGYTMRVSSIFGTRQSVQRAKQQ